MERVLDIVKSNPEVDDARIISKDDILVEDWVRDACRDCEYFGKSWSCPPGTGEIGKRKEDISGFRKAVFLRFRSSGNRAANEKAVLDIESALKRRGFARAMGFFTSPCTGCENCSYPERCPRPGRCRPTGESWGIDLVGTSKRARLDVEIVGAGEEFRPVTLFLVA
jgi:predicted metal-binding protein